MGAQKVDSRPGKHDFDGITVDKPKQVKSKYLHHIQIKPGSIHYQALIDFLRAGIKAGKPKHIKVGRANVDVHKIINRSRYPLQVFFKYASTLYTTENKAIAV